MLIAKNAFAGATTGAQVETPAHDDAQLGTFYVWARHLLCLVMPLTTLAFLLTGPHSWWSAPLFLLPLYVSVIADMRSPGEYSEPTPNLPSWPFDGILYLLFALQLANVVLAARLASITGVLSIDMFVAVQLVGINSGYSGIVVAHELIHRNERHLQFFGRVLMGSTLYEHFCTEHVRGHHARIGTIDDPATARFGETFVQFFRRTVPAQFKSAWAIENRRLGIDGRVPLRMWHQHHVIQGLVGEWGFAALLFVAFGPAGLLVHLLQSFHAVAALEGVNFFEHWGLVRTTRKVRPADSWDTDSRFTMYALVGLSRHADHHAYAARPYQQLRHWEESAKLPYGYFGMVMMVWFRNGLVRQMLTKELKRKKLGPFREGGQGVDGIQGSEVTQVSMSDLKAMALA